MFRHFCKRISARLWPLLTACLVGTSTLGHAGTDPSNSSVKVVRVGVYANAPKISMGNDGRMTGIFGDLLVAMAEKQAWALTPVPCEWQACLEALQAGRIDLMPDVAYTTQRAEWFDFHNVPALQSWSQLYKPRGATINSMLDLRGKRIAVVKGSVQATYLKSLLESFAVDATLVPVSSFERGFEMAGASEVDAVVANRFFGDIQAPKYQVESTAVVFQPAQLYYVTAKGKNADLLQAIDKHLKEWQAQSDSPYAVALNNWLQAPAHFAIPAYLWWILAALVGLLALALAATTWLRRQVKRQTADLRASEDRLNTILNSVDAAIYIKDTELRYQYANNQMRQRFDVAHEPVVGETDSVFFDEATASKRRLNDLRVIEHGERMEEEECKRDADGALTHSYWSVKLPLRDPHGTIYGLCGISTDITKRKQAEEAIHQLAFYDPLTGLPNRRLMQDRLQQLLNLRQRTQHCAALLFVDVDNFKDINDTLGHAVGDKLLCQIAKRMSECIRSQDTLARQGGDEFVVALIDLNPNPVDAARHAQKVAKQILARVSEIYNMDGQHCHTSVSIGMTLIDRADLTRDELYKQADLAMYQAKADGRNTVRFFNPAMQAQVIARTSLEADLRWALDSQEFMLYYQPQVDREGITFGYEALLRWHHPMRGLVMPREFIPAAEASSVILPLGYWVLKSACQQLVAWAGDDERKHLTIAINVSLHQVHQADFVTQVQAVLASTGVNPTLLELELTENQLINDVDDVIEKMNALRALGLRLSLDDFGTGYSSLTMLKRLPLHQLKIDQSFVRDMLTDTQNSSIVLAILTMGNSLSLDVMAEGVETVEQHRALLAMGCRYFQGFLYGQPEAVKPNP